MHFLVERVRGYMEGGGGGVWQRTSYRHDHEPAVLELTTFWCNYGSLYMYVYVYVCVYECDGSHILGINCHTFCRKSPVRKEK